eukprot:gene7784-8629_t
MNGKGELIVDKTNVIKTVTDGNYTMLNTDGELFIGGLVDIARQTRSIHSRGFVGCFRSLKIGIKRIDLMKNATAGHHITNCKL